MALHPDHGLTQAQVEARYGDREVFGNEHPHFPRTEWQWDVDQKTTDQAYWPWVMTQLATYNWDESHA